MNWQKIKLLVHMCWFEAQRFRAFPLEIVASIASRVVETGLFIVFWLMVGQFSNQGNIDARDVISYYIIMSGLVPFFFTHLGIASQTMKMIKRGELNQILIRPIDPIFYPWAVRFGRNFISLLFNLVQVIVGIVIAGGINLQALPYLLPVLLNMAALNAAFNLLVATMAFYLTEGAGIKNAAVHIMRLCRGELIPLFLMPASVAAALQFTPFPASQYHLSILLQGERLPEWGFVVIGSIWAIGLLFVAMRFWKYSLRKYEAIGI